MQINEAKSKLDRVIQLSRVEMYKPIQIAETLREIRTNPTINPLALETYRNLSKELRDKITRDLFGKVSTSSMRYQDDIWNDSALPPEALHALSTVNQNNSMVEEYIYQHVFAKNKSIIEIRSILDSIKSFDDLQKLLDAFDNPGLRTSADRLYEVFAVSILQSDIEKSDYKIILQGNKSTLIGKSAGKLIEATQNQDQALKLSKMGRTNAADAGIDIWTNFGVVISVKNYDLSSDLLKNILSETPVGHLVIVCENVNRNVIDYLKNNLDDRPISIVTKSELILDAKKLIEDVSMSGQFLNKLRSFFDEEFPLSKTLENFMKSRNYDISNPLENGWGEHIDS